VCQLVDPVDIEMMTCDGRFARYDAPPSVVQVFGTAASVSYEDVGNVSMRLLGYDLPVNVHDEVDSDRSERLLPMWVRLSGPIEVAKGSGFSPENVADRVRRCVDPITDADLWDAVDVFTLNRKWRPPKTEVRHVHGGLRTMIANRLMPAVSSLPPPARRQVAGVIRSSSAEHRRTA
jgi:hypothetical protein